MQERRCSVLVFLVTFLKGIVVGVGGVAPGLSGSVLLVILGLYEKVISAIGTLFRNFKKNIQFLLPMVAGVAIGVLAFSKLVDYLLDRHEFYTRYAFLGLVVGTVPLFYREVRKNGFRRRYYLLIAAAAAAGTALFLFNKNLFPVITQPNLWQSMLLGVAVAGSSIIPGVDSAAILSTLGLYELWVSSLAQFDLWVLIPAAFGVAVGVLALSALMNLLIKKAYTATFSVVFGLFLTIIPGMLNEKCAITSTAQGIAAVLLVIVGFCISFYLGDIKGNNERIKAILNKRK